MRRLTAPALTILVVGCGGGGGSTAVAPPPPPAYVLAPTVKQLTPASSEKVVAATASTVTLNKAPTALVVGDILMSTQGDGLLRRVTGIHPGSGTVVLDTVQVPIEQAIEEGTVTFSQDLDTTDFLGWTPSQQGLTVTGATGDSRAINALVFNFVNFTIGTDPEAPKAGKIVINGQLTLSARMEGTLTFGNFRLQHARFQPTVSLKGTLRVGLEGSLTKKIRAGPAIDLGAFTAGPILFRNKLQLFHEAKIAVGTGLELTQTIDETIGRGAEYTRSGGWQPITIQKDHVDLHPSGNVYVSGTAEVIPLRAEIQCLAYGTAGAFVFSEGAAGTEIKVTTSPFSAEVSNYIALRAGFGLMAEVFGLGIQYEAPNLEFRREFPKLTFEGDADLGVVVN